MEGKNQTETGEQSFLEAKRTPLREGRSHAAEARDAGTAYEPIPAEHGEVVVKQKTAEVV